MGIEDHLPNVRSGHTHDRRCVLFVCPTLLANPCLCVVEAVAEVVEFFRRPELVCHRSVVDHVHYWIHVVGRMVVEICPCRLVKHENADLSLRLLSGLLERWQASFKHAVSNCELSTPGIGASFPPLSMQVANTSSSSRTYSCKFLQIARINGVTAIVVLG